MNAPTPILMDVDQPAALPFPPSLPEFQRLFPDDAACAEYLEKARWGDGFVCPHCGVTCEPFRIATRPGVLTCRKCRRQTGLTVGTVMERSHTPLSIWFWAAYLVASQTPGMSAVQFQRQLGLSRYETAFQILHKLRAGMVRPDQDRIGGRANEHVEVDETWVGGRTRGEGRGVHHKVPVACAVEVRHRNPGTAQDKRKDGRYAGRVRLAVAADRSAKSLCGFVDGAVAPGTLVVTDDWSGYASLRKRGYDHHAIAECGRPASPERRRHRQTHKAIWRYGQRQLPAERAPHSAHPFAYPARFQGSDGAPQRRRRPGPCGERLGLRRVSDRRPRFRPPRHARSRGHRCDPGPDGPFRHAVCGGSERLSRNARVQVAVGTGRPTCRGSGWRPGRRPRTRCGCAP